MAARRRRRRAATGVAVGAVGGRRQRREALAHDKVVVAQALELRVERRLLRRDAARLHVRLQPRGDVWSEMSGVRLDSRAAGLHVRLQPRGGVQSHSSARAATQTAVQHKPTGNKDRASAANEHNAAASHARLEATGQGCNERATTNGRPRAETRTGCCNEGI